MEIILVRHGDPDYKNDCLTDLGHKEAMQLSQSFQQDSMDAVYVSPLGRAQQTMQYTAEKLGKEYETLAWLRELDAPFIDGRIAWEIPGTHVLSRDALPDLENWHNEPLYGKEVLPMYQEIATGFDATMKKHGYQRQKNMYRISQSTDEKLAFFCHKGVILTLLGHLMHWAIPLLYPHVHIDTTGVTRILWREHDGWAVPQIRLLNDTSHLDGVPSGN